MNRKKIQIIYAKNTLEVYNRQAALGSYIYSLAGLLEEKGNYTVFVNNVSYSSIQPYNAAPTSQKTKGAFLKRMIPSRIKCYLKERGLLNRIESLNRELQLLPASDLILEFYSLGSNIGYEISRKNNIPLIIVYDAPIFEEYRIFNGKNPLHEKEFKEREHSTLQAAAVTVVYSSAIQKFLTAQLGKEIPVEIHQNVDFTRFDHIERKIFSVDLSIGFIGSFLKWHRVDLLLEAFERLKREGYSLKLFLLGTGEEFDRIKQKVALSDYNLSIELPGFVDGTQLLEYKQKINIGVMPGSNWYGAPNKIFEYGAAGMGVVAPETPTISELFKNGEEVLFFKEGSGEDLYMALKKLCDDRKMLQNISASLQKKIKTNYSKNNTFDMYNRLISRLIP